MKTRSIIFQLVYALIAALVLIGTVIGSDWLNYPIKPLILIWITVCFLLETKPQPYRWLVILAFFFSWVGDVLLMMSSKNELLFFAGVGGFFLSQITYIQVFRRFSIQNGKGFIARKPIRALPFLVYLVVIYIILYPSLEGIMKPVVAVYAVALIGMSIAAFNRKGLMETGSFQILFMGSVFFVISDSLLAINKFAAPIPYEGILVMGTYMIAQYLIMTGLLGSEKTVKR